MSLRFSQVDGAEPVLGKLAAGAKVPSGTADTDLPAKLSWERQCFRICSLQHRWEGRNWQSSLKGLVVLLWHRPSTDSAPSDNLVGQLPPRRIRAGLLSHVPRCGTPLKTKLCRRHRTPAKC